MAKIGKQKRRLQIRLRQKRRQTIKKLKELYKNATTKEEKEKIIEKFKRKLPHLNPSDYLK
ncbi:MAG: hypothetical protein ACPLKV_01620 [Minisyncoccia bacterium]